MYTLNVFCDCLDGFLTEEEFKGLPEHIKKKYTHAPDWKKNIKQTESSPNEAVKEIKNK